MKRYLALLLVLVLSFSLYSSDNGNYQKIYAIDDEIYQNLTDLYILTGRALPSTSGPWSGSELKNLLEKISYDSLDEVEKALYDSIKSELDGEAFSPVFDFHIGVNLEGYINTNTESKFFHGWDNWFFKQADTKPALQLISEEHIGENFYGFIDFSLGVAKTRLESDFTTDKQVGYTVFGNNIPLIMRNDMKQFDFNFPYRAFVAAGGNNFSLQVGRERLSWGPGMTGNLIIGDHIKYHNTARITAFDDGFKYTFALLGFPHPQNYYYDGSLHPNGTGAGQSQYLNGISMFIAHRLEWRLFNDKVGFALTEGAMYMSKDNKIDLIALSPAHVFHNSYTRSLTNSILGFEIDYTPFDGFNVYASLVIDEFVFPGEPVPGDINARAAEPSAMGVIAGATYKHALGKGILTVNGEFAFTDPYLYLRDGDQQVGNNYYRTQKRGDWGINYVVAIREMIGAGGTQYYDEQFLGYRYGGDAIVGDISATYRVPSKYALGAELFYMAHGTHDKWTVWTRVNTVPDTNDVNGPSHQVPNSSTPTTEHVTENHKDANAQLRDSISHSFVVALKGSYEIGWGFSVRAEMDWINVINPGNLKANGTQSTMQFVIGASWTY